MFLFYPFHSLFAKHQHITLLPHQQFTFDYFTKNSELKGLLINHSLGSGKTFVALAISDFFKDKKVLTQNDLI